MHTLSEISRGLKACTGFTQLVRALLSQSEGFPLLTRSGQEVLAIAPNGESFSAIDPTGEFDTFDQKGKAELH